MENSVVVPQNIKNRVSYDAATFFCYLLENLKTFIPKEICTPMFFATLFTVAKTWRQKSVLW